MTQAKRVPWWKKFLVVTVSILVILALAGYIVVRTFSEPLPQGVKSPEADALARAMMEATHHAAWEDSTYAVSWEFAGMHRLLWDKKRHLAQVKWDKFTVLVDLNSKEGKAWKKEERVHSTIEQEKVMIGWRYWVNDAFWLNPVAKMFDPGTERKLVKLEEGDEAVLITYTAGGNTPGDSYLWIPDENNLPKRWKLWVSIVPIGGFDFTWEGWETTETGAKISTLHKSAIFDLKINSVTTYSSLSALKETSGGEDPFAAILP